MHSVLLPKKVWLGSTSHNQKAFTFNTSLFFILPYMTYMKPQTKADHQTTTESDSLMQELSRHLQWSEDRYSILKKNARCHEHYMSTYLYIWFISYVQTDLAKIKDSTRGV